VRKVGLELVRELVEKLELVRELVAKDFLFENGIGERIVLRSTCFCFREDEMFFLGIGRELLENYCGEILLVGEIILELLDIPHSEYLERI
jgi:hypothetical protein